MNTSEAIRSPSVQAAAPAAASEPRTRATLPDPVNDGETNAPQPSPVPAQHPRDFAFPAPKWGEMFAGALGLPLIISFVLAVAGLFHPDGTPAGYSWVPLKTGLGEGYGAVLLFTTLMINAGLLFLCYLPGVGPRLRTAFCEFYFMAIGALVSTAVLFLAALVLHWNSIDPKLLQGAARWYAAAASTVLPGFFIFLYVRGMRPTYRGWTPLGGVAIVIGLAIIGAPWGLSHLTHAIAGVESTQEYVAGLREYSRENANHAVAALGKQKAQLLSERDQLRAQIAELESENERLRHQSQQPSADAGSILPQPTGDRGTRLMPAAPSQ